MSCFRDDDDDDVHGNPLVAGFQEDLAPDDELKTPDRSISNVVLHNQLSSDEDASTSVLRPLSKNKDSLTAKSGTGSKNKDSLSANFGTASVVNPGIEGSDKQVRKISGEPGKSPAVPDVMADSSEDEMAGCGVVVRQDDDISEEEEKSSEQQMGTVSAAPVCTAFLLQPSVAVLSQLLARRPGMPCQKM